ncbi:MAG TPA: peptidoglycan-binding domain-containing protein [Xanthobacteraceae bacterium]|nr:peptidoglycan-binding domain-containing protein [Xanthobacteraceae bacterium]
MPKRRKTRVPLHRRAASAGGALLFGIWERAAQRPMDYVAILAAATLSTIVVANAIFLQTGSRSAPYFAPPGSAAGARAAGSMTSSSAGLLSGSLQVTGATAAKPSEQVVALRPVGAIAPQPVSARRDDPIADLIGGPSPRVMAVQRALSEYGYGQIKQSGVLDDPTSSAIQKFEREHKMPVTGRISERLLSELTALVGHPLN